jgi:hypothetical protein
MSILLQGSVRIKLALKAVESQTESVRKKLAITYSILCEFKKCLGSNYDQKMIWAAFTLAHFGCLRTAEFVSVSENTFDKTTQLVRGDVSLCSLKYPEMGLSIHLKFSKTDSTGF